jgi:hypothetical protein
LDEELWLPHLSVKSWAGREDVGMFSSTIHDQPPAPSWSNQEVLGCFRVEFVFELRHWCCSPRRSPTQGMWWNPGWLWVESNVPWPWCSWHLAKFGHVLRGWNVESHHHSRENKRTSWLN